jgi:hypothetical protein
MTSVVAGAVLSGSPNLATDFAARDGGSYNALGFLFFRE